jgi:hypothetical protein
MFRRLRRSRALTASLLAGLVVAAVPAAAHAQSLHNVAIATEASGATTVLDVSGASTANGAPVIQWYGNFGGNQRWNFVDQGDGTETIVNQNSGKCLTTDGVNGDQLFQFVCVNAPSQRWQSNIEPVDQHLRTIRNPWSGLDMDVSGGSFWAGAAIIGWYPNGGDNQYFNYYQLW